MKRVFVSYSRNNLDVVTQLIQDLQAVGIDTWYDQSLTGGQRWWDNILANIRECDIFIFALSPESWASEACKSELGYVVQLSKTVLPVLVADGINLNLLPRPLHGIQVTDCRRGDKEATFALIKSINMAPAAAPLPDPLPTPPHVPVSYLSNLSERIESTEPLSSQEQKSLLNELEEGLQKGRSPTEIRALLLSLKRRDDLLAKVATKIDEMLKSLEDKAPIQPPTTPAYAHPERGAGDYRRAAAPVRIPEPEPNAPKVARSKSHRYACAPSDTSWLIADVKNWLNIQGFDSQQVNTETQDVLLQVKKRGGWRDFVGMSTSLNIVFHQSDDTLTVEIGAGKWIDKAAVGAVGMLILWPFVIPAGFGAWEQMKMPEKVFDYIRSRLVTR